MSKTALLLIATLGLAACVPNPRDYETAPVQLKTPQGVVTCQLYTKKLVAWDRSIDRPAGMSVRQADDYCQAEGERMKKS